MAFNLQEFRSQITKHGFAQQNLFIVRIYPPEQFAPELPSSDLQFFASSATLPEFSLGTTDVVHNGMGAATKKPTGMEYPILPVTFFVDSNHNMLKFFHRWIQKIVNYDRSGGPYGTLADTGALPFEIGYKADYQSTIEIIVFPRHQDKKSYIYTFSNAYPINVGNISTSWSDEGLMNLSVGFAYDTLKVSGVDTPKMLTGSNSANSLLTYFSTLNTVVQSFRDIDSPLDVQNAINQSSRVLDRIFD